MPRHGERSGSGAGAALPGPAAWQVPDGLPQPAMLIVRSAAEITSHGRDRPGVWSEVIVVPFRGRSQERTREDAHRRAISHSGLIQSDITLDGWAESRP